MERASRRTRPSPRVYTIAAVGPVVLAMAIAVVLSASPTGAQVDLTVTPGMVKGPATAPVTIVEFSDYQ